MSLQMVNLCNVERTNIIPTVADIMS